MAWDALGHHLVARVAAADLPPATKAAVDNLLGKDSLVKISTLPDEWRTTRRETAIWHFVDIPLNATGYDKNRDCRNGDCLVGAFQRNERILADPTQSQANRRDALIYIVHLIADAHQPLHTTSNNDRGGNDVKITYKNTPMTLHKYWDVDVLNPSEDEAKHADRLIALARGKLSARQRGNIESWVNESHQLAVYVYQVPSRMVIDSPYERWSREKADEQLALAGLRLRAMLMRIFPGGGR